MSTDRQEPDRGVQLASSEGGRSSQDVGREVLADAVAGVDESLARRIASTKDWRKKYLGPLRDVVVAGAASAKDALRIASDGLGSVHGHLTFVGEEERPLPEVLASTDAGSLRTGLLSGEGPRVVEFSLPYRGELLRGDGLRTQLDRWVAAGTIEAGSALAIDRLVDDPEWLDLSDHHFVLLGAASQMGPLRSLLEWRANVTAVDLPHPHIWDYIGSTALRGSGTLRFPTRDGELSGAGVDLLTELPESSAWIGSLDAPYVLGNYVYADGSTFLRIAGAVDALIERELEARRLTMLAYLATPTDVFAVSEEIAREARGSGAWAPFRSSMRALSFSKLYHPNYDELVQGDGRAWGISDCLVPIQGPNYALSKAMQRWRAVTTREEGTPSSANVAPATRTTSVTKNRMLAAAYSQAHRFGIEIFEPETSRVLMAGLLVHDLRNPSAAARPEIELQHPFDLFVDNAVHGGIWRMRYEPRSVLPVGLLRGVLTGGGR